MKAKSAIGSRSMLAPANASVIRRLLNRLATKHGVKVYRYANGGNHLHMLVKIHNREMFKNFLRVASGLIARHVLRAGRGPAANPEASRNVQKRHLRTGPRNESVKREAFWSQRPYTRIATWGREWRNLVNYFRLNNLEAIGFVNHQPRGRGSASKRLHFMSLPVDSA
jgi:REP element-mobilizing transposase RayT